MYAFDYVWPHMGLGAALLLALLLATDLLRSNRGGSRWRDLVWLTWLGTLADQAREKIGTKARVAEIALRKGAGAAASWCSM